MDFYRTACVASENDFHLTSNTSWFETSLKWPCQVFPGGKLGRWLEPLVIVSLWRSDYQGLFDEGLV